MHQRTKGFAVLCVMIGVVATLVAQESRTITDEFLVQRTITRVLTSIRVDRPNLAASLIEMKCQSKTDKLFQGAKVPDAIEGVTRLQIDSMRVAGQVAYVDCHFLTCPDSVVLRDRITLRKAGRSWLITGSDLVVPLWELAKTNKGGPIPQHGPNPHQSPSQVADIIYTNRLLIPREVPYTTVEHLTGDIIQQNTTTHQRVFCNPIDMELVAFTPSDAVGFFLDRTWDRVVIADITNDWIGAYGDGPNEYGIHSPSGLAVSPDLQFFVAVPSAGEIARFQFTRSTHTVSFISASRLEGVSHPCDIVYDNLGTTDISDDQIWVADDFDNKIVQLDRQLNVLQTLVSYSDDLGNITPISRPHKILEADGSLGYISGSSSFVSLYLSPGPQATAYLLQNISFGSASRLTSVGIDPYSWNYLISDEGLRCIHAVGGGWWCPDYLASYKNDVNGNQLFASPKFVSSSGPLAVPNYHYIDIGTIDTWGPSTGIRDFLPGADALRLTARVEGTWAYFDFIFSGVVKDSVFVTNADGSYRYCISTGGNFAPPGWVHSNTSAAGFPYGLLKLQVKFKPWNDDGYGRHQQGWITREIEFTNPCPSPSPTISGFSQFPNPMYNRRGGTVICNLQQDPRNYRFLWHLDDGDGYQLRPHGNTAYLYYIGGRSSPFRTTDPDAPCNCKITVSCDVSNDCGHSWGTFGCVVEEGPPPGGCPFVYTWDGTTYVEDNNVLPQCEDPDGKGKDVTDFYHLFTRPTRENDRYRLIVGEFEQEHSYLDQARLVLIDHPLDTFVTVDDSGRVVQFEKPAAFLDAQLDSSQVIKQLTALDNVKVEVCKNDTMRLWFSNDGSTLQQGLLVVGHSGQNEEKRPVAAEVRTRSRRNNLAFTSFRLRRNNSYAWMLVPAADTTTQQIDINWKQSASADFCELSKKVESQLTVRDAQMVLAKHSTAGDVTQQLSAEDQNYAELSPDEWIDLEFAAPPLAQGYERTFVFVSRGRYEHSGMKPSVAKNVGSEIQPDAHTVTPTNFDMAQNFPNPFNPTTTIKYQLPSDNHVSIELFDMLGRRVATLVDETKQAGYYEVPVNVASLASGVYLYRMTSGSYTATKKMVILR